VVEGAEYLVGQQWQRAVAHGGLDEPFPPGLLGRGLVTAEGPAQPLAYRRGDRRVLVLETVLPGLRRFLVALAQRQRSGQQFDGERRDLGIAGFRRRAERGDGLLQAGDSVRDPAGGIAAGLIEDLNVRWLRGGLLRLRRRPDPASPSAVMPEA
jgi:hypothetical protein